MTMSTAEFEHLIQAARVQGLSEDLALQEEVRAIVGSADQAKRPLTPAELKQVCDISNADPQVAIRLQDRANALVDQARNHLLREQPQLVQPGGALYPAERAEACWRDCWQFFRVIIYAYVCARPDFTNPEGMAALRQLYQQMNVPVLGLNIALKQLQGLTVAELGDTDTQATLTATFEHLRSELNKSAVKT